MKIKRICQIYFSPTGTTEKVVQAVSAALADDFDIKSFIYDFALPQARTSFPQLAPTDLVLFGCPTYAGRLPNLLLKYLDTIDGSGAIAVPIVTFGNRAFDNSLIELRNILEAHGFHTIAAAAFACEHSFSTTLGAGRPDAEDLAEAATFAHAVIGKLAALAALDTLPAPIAVDGDAEAGYYQPRDRHGVFIDIRKVKPLTSDACDQCGLCAAVCPMGAIDPSDVMKVPGICIKCGACIKKCPQSAKYYDDTGYLYHKEELEAMYGVCRAANSFYLSF